MVYETLYILWIIFCFIFSFIYTYYYVTMYLYVFCNTHLYVRHLISTMLWLLSAISGDHFRANIDILFVIRFLLIKRQIYIEVSHDIQTYLFNYVRITKEVNNFVAVSNYMYKDNYYKHCFYFSLHFLTELLCETLLTIYILHISN